MICGHPDWYLLFAAIAGTVCIGVMVFLLWKDRLR
jgi:hypothetical protein